MSTRIYLALQVFADGRVMFRRWSPDAEVVPGGQYQRQNIDAFRWLHACGMPEWDQEPSLSWHPNFGPPFEEIP